MGMFEFFKDKNTVMSKFKSHQEWIIDTKNGSRATIEGGDLSYSNFQLKDLSGIILINCNLTGVVFKGTCLKGAIIKSCNCTDVVFDFADMSDITMTNNTVIDSSFRATILNDAIMKHNIIKLSRFVYSNLTGADFGKSNMESCTIYKTVLKGTEFNNVSFIDTFEVDCSYDQFTTGIVGMIPTINPGGHISVWAVSKGCLIELYLANTSVVEMTTTRLLKCNNVYVQDIVNIASKHKLLTVPDEDNVSKFRVGNVINFDDFDATPNGPGIRCYLDKRDAMSELNANFDTFHPFYYIYDMITSDDDDDAYDETKDEIINDIIYLVYELDEDNDITTNEHLRVICADLFTNDVEEAEEIETVKQEEETMEEKNDDEEN